jgi:hypothetical protein
MKKHLSLILTMALLMAVTFGCKVGAEDPASLGSRDGRLVAKWKLTNVEGTSIYTVVGIVNTTTTTYDGTILTEVHSPGTTQTTSYTLEMTIAKGGELTSIENEDGTTTNETGDWDWMDSDKKKSDLYLGNNTKVGGNWTVLRLSSKELILERVNIRTITASGSSATYSDDFKYTFTAQ